MLDAVTFCVTFNEPVISTLPFTSNVAFAFDLFTPTPDPPSNIELVVSVVLLLNFEI
jgi:hypothetical protein